MNRIGHSAWMIVLAALLAASCGGRATTTSDAGAEHHDAADAQGDALADICESYTSPFPPDPGYPYIYYCSHRVSLPNCKVLGQSGYNWI